MAAGVGFLVACVVLVVPFAPARVGGQETSIEQFQTAVGVETEAVQLFCRVTNRGVLASVFWYLERADGDLALGLRSADYAWNYPKYQLAVAVEEGWYNLTVNDLALEDGGPYECLVSDGLETVEGSVGVLEVLPATAPPSGPTCQADYVEPLTEGDEIRARCQTAEGGRPESRLSWLDGSGLPVGGAGPGPNWTHSWSAAAADDGAVYTCSETHPFLEGTRSCTVGPLSVRHAPVVTITPAEPRPRDGDEVVLNCSALANPPLDNLTWTFGGAELESENDTAANYSEARVTVEDALNADGAVVWSLLTIDEVTEEDFGVELTCSGRNGVGDGRATAVLRPPDPPEDSGGGGGGGGTLADNPGLIIAIDLAALAALVLLGLCFIVAPKCGCLVCDRCRARVRRERKRKRREKRRRATEDTHPADTAVENPTYDA